jgi:hypothetical protein
MLMTFRTKQRDFEPTERSTEKVGKNCQRRTTEIVVKMDLKNR